jgi:putative membrane protein
MKILRYTLALALGAATWAAADADTKQPATTKDTERASTTGPEERLLAKLHETNQMEIEFGKLAQQKGSTAAVKDYGKQLEQDHKNADNKVTSIAREKNITLDKPAAMNDEDAKKSAEQKAALARLKKMEGTPFDQEFMKVMAEGHEHALALVRDSKASVRDEKIKSHLNEVEPVLEKHKSMAQGGGHDEHHGMKKTDKSDTSGKSKSSTTGEQPKP